MLSIYGLCIQCVPVLYRYVLKQLNLILQILMLAYVTKNNLTHLEVSIVPSLSMATDLLTATFMTKKCVHIYISTLLLT